MAKIDYIYFDSCVFLAYFNNELDRADIVEQLLDEIAQDDKKYIVTSSISITEVAFVAGEKRKDRRSNLKPGAEEEFDLLWRDASIVRFIDFQENLARKASG